MTVCPPELELTLQKAIMATHMRPALVTTGETVKPPRLIPRRLFSDAVSQLYHAELATAGMCRQMAGRTGSAIADRLLQFQAADERHHADLYESYLARVGDIRPQDSRIAESLEMLLDTSLGQEAAFAGYNVVLEGEALKLQQDAIERFSCPALGRITRAIARDEARHVSFGYAYLSKRLPSLEQEHRFDIYRHIRKCWAIAAAPPPDGTGAFSSILTRKRSDYMSARWQHHHHALARIGLINPNECAPA